MLNKDPRNNRWPSSWGHYNTRDTIPAGDINMEEGLTGLHHQSLPMCVFNGMRYFLINQSFLSSLCRSRSLLPATSRYAHSWHQAPLGPTHGHIFVQCQDLCPFSRSLILFIDKGGVGLQVYAPKKSKFSYDRRFSRPVCLGIKHPSEAYDQIFITVRQLQACWCGELSLTGGRICRLPVSVSSSTSLVSM
jgi:hypothetical protein